MKFMSPRGFSLKTLVFASVCLLACFNLGMSLECSGITCGHGTKSRCNSEGNCICKRDANFTNIQQERLFGQDVQYCLNTCDNGNKCPENYLCKPDAPLKGRCVCAVGYRRSVNGECEGSCAAVSCGTRQYCSDTNKRGDCITQICEMGYQLLNNGTCKGLSLKCNKVECGFGTESFCNRDGSCRCSNRFINRQQELLFGQDVQYCLRKCSSRDACRRNYTCKTGPASNLRCECAEGYRRSVNGECVASCTVVSCGAGQYCSEGQDGAFCIEKDCEMGYQLNATGGCIDERSAARVTDGNSGSSLGLYVGVAVGVLVLLGLIVAAIFVRRRRNSKKSSEGGAQTEQNQNSSNGYEDISLDNEDVDLPTETRKEKTVSVEYSNGKIPLNKTARNLDGGLKDQGGYHKEGILPHNNRPEIMTKPPNPVITAKFDDTEAYNILDAFRLSAKNKSPTQHQIAGVTSESDSQGVYNTLYEEHALPNNKKDKENMAAFPDPVNGDTVDDSDAYNTLDAFNLSTQNKPETDTRMEEDVDHYNIVL